MSKKKKEKTHNGGHSTDTWLGHFKIVKVIENKEGLRNRHRSQETGEAWQLNAM